MFIRNAFLAVLAASLLGSAAIAAPAKKPTQKPATKAVKPAQSASPDTASSDSAGPPPSAQLKAPNLTPQYNAYVNQIRGKLNSAWNYPDGKHHVTIQCVLSADGNVSDFSISSSPKSSAAEEAANQAFNQAQPFEALPGNTPSARLTLTFDSTSTQHDSSSNLKTHLEPLGKVALPVNP